VSQSPIVGHTPMSMAVPTAPAGYTWEATSEAVAEKYGLPVEEILRFDLNTSPAPPDLVARVLAANIFETNLSEYPPSDYRRLSEAAARVYGVTTREIVVGAGADEVLDMCAKAFLAPGLSAVIAIPTYTMYRVVSEQRGAEVIAVPRLGREHDYAMDLPAMRAAARRATLVWICNPNNPTGRSEPAGAIEALVTGIEDDAAADGRLAPAVVVDEAYAEFAGASLVPLLARHPRLVIVRTASKAYALAGLRVGFALAQRETLELIEPYRPPGSVSTVSVTVVTEALLDPNALESNLERVDRERARLYADLVGLGWRVAPSVTNFLLVDFGSAERAELVAEGLLRRGIVPRTFSQGHPLVDHLRFTVRNEEQNARLVTAAREIDGECAARGADDAPGERTDVATATDEAVPA
jgi:histidinol-phosphate aminotransferase